MIRFDILEIDFPKIKNYISDGKKVTYEPSKPGIIEIMVDDNNEGGAFGEVLEELKIKVLKKRVF